MAGKDNSTVLVATSALGGIAPPPPPVVEQPTQAAPKQQKPKKKVDLNNLSFNIDFKAIWEKMPWNRRPAKGLEINLVPDVKDEMIKTLKLRNLIFFVCIVVAGASVAVAAVFGSIAGGQQAVVDNRKDTLSELSGKVKSYSDLGDFLTIRDQLGNLASIAERKTLLSRTFGILVALIPHGADKITLSELSVNLSGDAPTFSFDAQANAKVEPYIDYNVLDAFKKSMRYMRYDYGSYVDKYGETIPEYCMIESGTDGATFSDAERGYYALWLITGEGCNPSWVEEEEEENETNVTESNGTNDTDGTNGTNETDVPEEEKTEEELKIIEMGYTPEMYNGQAVVRIWRTPQFQEWYDNDMMTISGTVSDVAHFESSCITYTGTEDERGRVTWDSTNNNCHLVPDQTDGSEGIRITDSSNGRGAGDELVLRFSAIITLNPEVYSFKNTHMLAIAPSGRYNVTDSYRQIQNMFEQRAADCAPTDTACKGN